MAHASPNATKQLSQLNRFSAGRAGILATDLDAMEPVKISKTGSRLPSLMERVTVGSASPRIPSVKMTCLSRVLTMLTNEKNGGCNRL